MSVTSQNSIVSGVSSNMMYAHVQRSSPNTATAIASATVTIQNVPNTIPPFASRGSTTPYQNQYHPNAHMDYRSDTRTKPYQISQVYGGDMYNPEHPVINDSHGFQQRQNHQNNMSRVSGRSRSSFHHNYQNQHQYYYNKTHASTESYGVNHSNYQGYHGDHQGYSHYNYSGNNVYSNESNENLGSHIPNSVSLNHEPNYYTHEAMQPVSKVPNQEYQNKVNYYENNTYNSNHLPPNSDSRYGMQTEIFPGTNNSTTGIMTPPASVHTENSDNYTNFHQFYGSDPQAPPGPPGEGSNSSSDFNFLSNLANDYTPEYYQI